MSEEHCACHEGECLCVVECAARGCRGVRHAPDGTALPVDGKPVRSSYSWDDMTISSGMRRFVCIDALSGRGPQFEGVVFTDGRVAVRWLTGYGSSAFWDDLETLLKAHVNPAGEVVRWLD